MRTIQIPSIEDIHEPEDVVIRNERDPAEYPRPTGRNADSDIDSDLDRGVACYSLGCGVFFTRGVWMMSDYATIQYGSTLRGRGIGWTEIRLRNPLMASNGHPRPDVAMLNIGSDYVGGSNASVSDLSLIASNSLIGDALVTSGVRGWGEGIRIERVKAGGIRGSVKPVGQLAIPYEAFGISFGIGVGGHRVADCEVYGEPGAYFSAYSSNADGQYKTIFERCVAFCQDGYAALTVYDHAVFRDCHAERFGYGVYNDTGDVNGGVLVDSCDLIVSRVGVGLVVTENRGFKSGIKIRDTSFKCLTKNPWVGLELIDRSSDKSGQFTDIEFVGCRFEGRERLTLLSTDAGRNNVRGVRFIDCQFRDDAVIRTGLNDIEIIRPRNLDGMLIEKQIPSVL